MVRYLRALRIVAVVGLITSLISAATALLLVSPKAHSQSVSWTLVVMCPGAPAHVKSGFSSIGACNQIGQVLVMANCPGRGSYHCGQNKVYRPK
jgi:hypothetical protein